jgi:hypothetical protein
MITAAACGGNPYGPTPRHIILEDAMAVIGKR